MQISISPLRRVITSVRFLEALDRVNEELGEQRALDALIEQCSGDLEGSAFLSLRIAPDFEFEKLFQRREDKLIQNVSAWLSARNIDTEWIQRVAIFTLLVHTRRPTARHWASAPVKGSRKIAFEFRQAGWDPEFESGRASAARLRRAFNQALIDHLAQGKRLLPHSKPVVTRKERRDLEWVSLRQAHGWSIAKIVRRAGLGNDNRWGGTGRKNVSETIDHWRRILEFL